MDKKGHMDDPLAFLSAPATAKSGKQASRHPVPTQLVDALMPRLKDTELRVLLVVLRQTWGWKADRTDAGTKNKTEAGTKTGSSQQANANRPTSFNQALRFNQTTKRWDWLSHSQLCQRAGRGSDAVSRAVASLAASGLVIVEDASGRALLTPEERRRCLGCLYFRPGAVWNQKDD